MSVTAMPVPPSVSPFPASSPTSVGSYVSCLFDLTGSEDRWDLTKYLALLALVLLWATRVYSTWATWGNLSIDAGHEMYVPAMLAEGKMLYRDVWYLYGPGAPYFNSYLFRLFGLHLNVLYWAGALSALGSAVLLFLVGMRLSSWLAGWTAGAVVVVQAFHTWLFNFPLPYSFASVYGCFVACLFLWFSISALSSRNQAWIFGCGIAAAAALLLKLEYGAACYITLMALIAARSLRQRSTRCLRADLLSILPGVIACGLVIGWMVSIRGVAFITQENILSWPTSFFMKTYGKAWLEHTGLTVTPSAIGESLLRTVFFAGVVLETYCVLWWKRTDTRSMLLRVLIFLALVAYIRVYTDWRAAGILSAIFFPRDMVAYGAAAAVLAWWHFWRQPDSDRSPAFPILVTFSSLLAARLLLMMTPFGYPIYYNGPAVFSFLLLTRPIVPRYGRHRRMVLAAESLICAGCLTVAVLQADVYAADRSRLVRLATERGTIYVAKQVRDNYVAGIQFMKEKASRGESVLAVTEDTSLYFLSGTECPTRVFTFNPGVVAPGKMTEDLIQEIDRKRVRYLLWSNRTFPEYGVPVFGKDFAQTLGEYFTSRYRRVGRLVPGTPTIWEVSLTVWERKPEYEIHHDRR